MATAVNINDVLAGHVALEVECVDRLVLNAYVASLQVPGQVVRFLAGHRGNPVPSPAVMGQIGNRFVSQVKAFAAINQVPVLRLAAPDRSRWDDRKLDHVRPYVDQAERDGRFGVVAIVSCQEFQHVFSGRNRATKPGAVWFEFFRERRRVGTFYFYFLDREFGPGFVKICTYFPYPAQVWVNGHEWSKRQAERAGIAFAALSNGFAACADPDRLQAICDALGPDDVQAFFDRSISQIPTPLTTADRAAGFWWELSLRQVEVSRTLVLDDPRRARAFFEALVSDNVGIGRPEEVSVVFARRVRKDTPGRFQTRVFSAGTDATCASTFATAAAASSSTSRTAARCGSRPSSTSPTTSASNAACATCPNSSPRRARSTSGCL